MTSSSAHSPGHSQDIGTSAADGEALFPDGYVVLATIAGESRAQGKTPVHLTHHHNPFESIEVLATRSFGVEDIGAGVVCMPIAGTQELMIMGLLPESDTSGAQTSQAPGVLDEVLASTVSEGQTQREPSSEWPADEGRQDQEVFSEPNEKVAHYNKVKVIADGEESEHVVLRAESAITLQCGEASISLTADGRVRINGRYIHSRASHTQRISGGAVKIN